MGVREELLVLAATPRPCQGDQRLLRPLLSQKGGLLVDVTPRNILVDVPQVAGAITPLGLEERIFEASQWDMLNGVAALALPEVARVQVVEVDHCLVAGEEGLAGMQPALLVMLAAQILMPQVGQIMVDAMGLQRMEAVLVAGVAHTMGLAQAVREDPEDCTVGAVVVAAEDRRLVVQVEMVVKGL